jgi:hypothetical protein
MLTPKIAVDELAIFFISKILPLAVAGSLKPADQFHCTNTKHTFSKSQA